MPLSPDLDVSSEAPAMAESSSKQGKPAARGMELALMAALGVGLVIGIVCLAVTLWPHDPRAGRSDDDETDPGAEGPLLLIATEEGVALLSDVFDHQMEWLVERRNRHTRESARALERHLAEADAQRKEIRDASEALAREGQRLPG